LVDMVKDNYSKPPVLKTYVTSWIYSLQNGL
jgi:hypothetical protein